LIWQIAVAQVFNLPQPTNRSNRRQEVANISPLSAARRPIANPKNMKSQISNLKSATAKPASTIAALAYDYPAQEKAFVQNCNLCGADDWTILTLRDRYGYPAKSTLCRKCGLTMLNPVMSGAAYGKFYQNIYRPLVSAFHGRLINAKTIQGDQVKYAEEMANFVEPYLAEKKRPTLLDVGGSTGVVSAYFAKRFGARATVLDPAPDEIDEAKALGIQTITSLVEDWDSKGQRFDVVAMFQTIDHLLDVAGTLRKLREVLAKDGVFIVDILDFRAAYLKNWAIEMAIKIDHPYYLTEETMDAFLLRYGFKTLRKCYSADHHISYVCAPAKPIRDALPPAATVLEVIREARFVQCTPQNRPK